MRIFSDYILVIGAAILSSNTTTFGYNEIDDALQRTTAMNLIFVKVYEVQISTYKPNNVENSRLSEFVDLWGDVLGEEDAKKMYQRMEPHLAYFLKQAISDESNFNAIVVALGIKLMALLQGINYFSCVIYHKRAYGGSPPKHCQSLTAHLLIFSDLCTKELIEKLYRLSEPIDNFFRLSKYSDNITRFFRNFLKHVRSSSKPQTHVSELSFAERDRLYSVIVDREIAPHRTLQGLSLKIVCGNFGSLPNRYMSYPKRLDHEMLFWQKSISVNEKLMQDYSGNPQLIKYAISNVLRAITIVRGESHETYRRSYSERFEGMLTNIAMFKIFQDRFKYINNLQLKDDPQGVPIIY